MNEMSKMRVVRVSKYLAKHLRHSPDRIGISLDESGWVRIDELIEASAAHGFPITRDELEHVVATNDKQRYAFDDGGLRIRANQGHSVDVELGLATAIPPDVLFHGTVERFLPAIKRDGLRPMRRHDVHLSADQAIAETVGARRGTPVILRVDAAGMVADGHEFRVSANGVWLVAAVPARYLTDVS